MKYDLFFYEAFEEEAASLAAQLPPSVRAGYTVETIQRSGHADPPAALLSIRTQSVLPPAWHASVAGVLARTTGYDHLRALAGLPDGPALACLPEYCTRAVAEQAALLWMALLRRLPPQLAQWPTFKRDGLTGGECAGRTLAVAGVGRIGHEVARIGRGLDMNVLGIDLVERHADIHYVPLPEALSRADILVSCMNLTPENRGLFNHATLGNTRPGCLFVNVARGELAVTADLIHLLETNHLGGVALDVFNDESHMADALRAGTNHPEAQLLLSRAGDPRVLLTPHNAFNTREALLRKAGFSVQQATTFLTTGRFEWPLVC